MAIYKTCQNIFPIIALLLILGCAGTTSKTQAGISTGKDYYKGSSGLNLKFLENTPKEVYENSQFILGIEIGNEGAYDIYPAGLGGDYAEKEPNERVGILAVGIEKDYISLSKSDWKNDFKAENLDDNTLTFNLRGKNVLTPLGEQGNIFIAPKTKSLAKQSQTLKSTITATACYPYRTEAVATVCIDTDITNTRIREKGCIVKDISLDSQGAPIAVTNIEVKMLPKGDDFVRPEFLIALANKGNGEAVNPDKIGHICGLEKIPPDERELTYNVVLLSAFLSNGEKQLRCEPADEKLAIVRLREKKGIARCILDEGVGIREGIFATPLQILIDYGYTFTISQDITIKKPER